MFGDGDGNHKDGYKSGEDGRVHKEDTERADKDSLSALEAVEDRETVPKDGEEGGYHADREGVGEEAAKHRQLHQ